MYYFEMASIEQPNNIAILEALKMAYDKSGQSNKAMETQEKIQALQG
ncbi:hypothetical protein [Lacinutrix sp. WUR7]|nr:hypothetical protein [Lacinutrix sp. WUR7]